MSKDEQEKEDLNLLDGVTLAAIVKEGTREDGKMTFKAIAAFKELHRRRRGRNQNRT